MSDPIIPGIDDARAREIAAMLASRERFSQWDFRGWGEEWFCVRRADLINANGYSTAAGRRLWGQINAQS